ncbi:hypothetical protein K474DRAFT_1673821 [Panus rudis PR-1116 ss-1]|nr:hypothetical protein K474DRAFT_1673821 [Panus rudis PR-1116 ss-1]
MPVFHSRTHHVHANITRPDAYSIILRNPVTNVYLRYGAHQLKEYHDFHIFVNSRSLPQLAPGGYDEFAEIWNLDPTTPFGFARYNLATKMALVTNKRTIPFGRLVEMPPPPRINLEDDPTGRLALHISEDVIRKNKKARKAFELREQRRETQKRTTNYHIPNPFPQNGVGPSRSQKRRAARKAAANPIYFSAVGVGGYTHPSTPVLAPSPEIHSPIPSAAMQHSFENLAINPLSNDVAMDLISLTGDTSGSVDLTQTFINDSPTDDVVMNNDAGPSNAAASGNSNNLGAEAEDNGLAGMVTDQTLEPLASGLLPFSPSERQLELEEEGQIAEEDMEQAVEQEQVNKV